jgi:hypothetical protein
MCADQCVDFVLADLDDGTIFLYMAPFSGPCKLWSTQAHAALIFHFFCSPLLVFLLMLMLPMNWWATQACVLLQGKQTLFVPFFAS